MTRKKADSDAARLRRAAEASIDAAPIQGDSEAETRDGLQRLYHELQVHQVELEMQNEELHRAKAELAAALSRYTDLFDFAPIGYLTLDRQGTIMAANFAAAALLGAERARLAGRPLASFLPDGVETLHFFLEKVFAGRRESWQGTLRSADAGDRYLRLDAMTVKEGAACGVAIVDLTQLHQLELFRTQVECVEDYAVYLLDPAGIILNWNAGAQRLEGYRAEEIVGRHFSCLFTPEDRAAGKPELELRKAVTLGRFEEECWRIRKDGSGFWADVVLTPLRDPQGRIWGFSKMTHDITARMQAEEALRRSEEKFSTIFHSVPVLIVITRPQEGTCIDINEPGLKVLGCRREEVIGKNFLELGVWRSPRDRERMLQALEEQGSVRDLEFEFCRMDGSCFTGLLSSRYVSINDQRYLLSIIKDISERKRLELQIAKLNGDLMERARELESANKELETFNYTVAHDLRLPLNTISGACQILEALLGDRLGDEGREYTQMAYQSTLRMDRLIEALLRFSRAGHQEPQRQLVELSGMVQEIAATLKAAEPARQVEFRVAPGVSAQCDPNLMRTVLENLLGNAWKHTRNRDAALIEFQVSELNRTPVYLVRDNGEGFDMSDAQRLFLPFQQLQEGPRSEGFGIGLATVERIIRQHGGRVWAEGLPGQGAAFFFTLQEN